MTVFVDSFRLACKGSRYVANRSLATNGWHVYSEDLWGPEDYYDLKVTPQTGQIKNYITVTAHPLYKDSAVSDIYSSDDENSFSTTEEITIKFDDIPVDPSTVSIFIHNVSGVSTLDSSSIYAWGAILTIDGGGVFTISATGTKYVAQEDIEYVTQAGDSVQEYGQKKYDFPTNHLLQNYATAKEIGDNLLPVYKDNRKDATITKPASTITQTGDEIKLVEYQDDTLTTINTFYITRSKIKFNGALDEELTLRRKNAEPLRT
jgi:hypothetical protein